MLIKKYEDLIEKLLETGAHWKAMHYWSVETTIEEFVETHRQLGLVKDKEEGTTPQIDIDFPYPELFRRKQKVPMSVAIQPDLGVMNYNMTIFSYPEGTTHIACELYSAKEYWSNLSCVCIKIDGDVESPDSQWYLWKKVDDVYTWVACEKGTRNTRDVHSIDELVEFSNKDHSKPEPYFIDSLIEALPYSIAKTVLTIYRLELTELFEARHDVYKLTQYFDYDRVWPIYEVEDDSHDATEEEMQNEKHRALNQLLYQSLNDDTFKSAYEFTLWLRRDKDVG